MQKHGERQLKNVTNAFYHRLGYGLNQNGELFEYLLYPTSILFYFLNLLLVYFVFIIYYFVKSLWPGLVVDTRYNNFS
jgi:hypothetical protein